MAAIARYWKMQSTKSEPLEVCYYLECTWLKGTQVAKMGGIPGMTVWSEEPLGHRKNGRHQGAALFPGIGAGKLAESSGSLCWPSAINCKLYSGHVTAFLGQNGAGHSAARLFSGGGEQVHALPSPLRFGGLNPSLWPELKHRRTVVPGMPTARGRQIRAEI